jgi:transcriptional regulator with XRE-family HTH domain
MNGLGADDEIGARAMRVLSSRLRELRLQRGGQRRLADLAGLTQETLIRWRKGKGNPRLSELESLADALGVSVVYLVSVESSEVPTLPGAQPDGARLAERIERLRRRAEKTSHELSAALEHAAQQSRKRP